MINVICRVEDERVKEILNQSKMLGIAIYGTNADLRTITDQKGLTYFVDEAFEEIRQEFMLAEVVKILEQIMEMTTEKINLCFETNENDDFKRKVHKFIFHNTTKGEIR